MRNRGNNKNINDGIKILMKYKTKKDFEKNERKNKEENTYEFNSQQENVTLLKRIIIIFFIFIIIIFLYLLLKYSSLIGIKILDFPKKSKEIINNSNTYYSMYDNNLLSVCNNDVKIFDRNFKVKYEYNLNSKFEPFIVNNDKYMIIADKSNSRIYIFDSLKNTANKKIEGKIEDLYVDNYGNFAVEYLTNEMVKKIDIFNSKGKIEYTMNLGKSSISNIKMFNDLNKIIILKNYSEGLNLGTKIEIVTENSKIEEFITLDNKFVFDIKLLNDKLLLLCNDEILEVSLINKKIKTIYNLTESQITNVKFNDTYFAIINIKDNKYYYSTFKYDLSEIGNVEISNIPKYVKSNKFVSYLVYENQIIAINKWGRIIKKFDIFSSPSDLIIFNEGKSIALIYSYKVEILNI